MSRASLNEDALEALAEAELADFEPDHAPRKTKSVAWVPDLNKPTQEAAFHDPAPYILLSAEKGTGKSVVAEHKLVRHCYENYDALGLIITPSIRTGKFGIIHDLETLILPSWESGIGLEWLPSKLDPNTKDRVLKIGNRHGGWSTILQIAIPYEEAVAARIKGVAPSFVLADELTDCNGRGYFSLVAAQLNRRRHIEGPQQYVATCNPQGPSHWVYKVFYEEPYDQATGKTDPRFKVYHLPFRENAHRPEMSGYLEKLELAVRGDPIAKARLIDGQWIEQPTGEALFREHYMPARHVVGDASAGTGLLPIKGLPCVIGYDIGQVYSAAVFMQPIPINNTLRWYVFDEVVHLKKKILLKNMASEVVERILEWNSAMGHVFAWEHVMDSSAVNQWRSNSGSYDAWEFEQEFNRASILHGIPQMRVKGCPKGDGSVSTRVRLTQAALQQDRMYISASCIHTRAMLLNLEGKKDEPLTPKKTASGHVHVFDALSYPIIRFEMHGNASFASPVSRFSMEN